MVFQSFEDLSKAHKVGAVKVKPGVEGDLTRDQKEKEALARVKTRRQVKELEAELLEAFQK